MIVPEDLIYYLLGGVFGFGPVVGLVLARRRIGVLNAASWLVIFGAIVVVGEHTNFAIQAARNYPIGLHSRDHIVMAATYTAVGALLLSVMARTLFRLGWRVGWYIVLLALVIGGGIDLLMVTLIYPHGVRPFSAAVGIALYSYHFAWIGALGISYRYFFGKTPKQI